eukprot:1860108-Amphidinium_carterae.2
MKALSQQVGSSVCRHCRDFPSQRSKAKSARGGRCRERSTIAIKLNWNIRHSREVLYGEDIPHLSVKSASPMDRLLQRYSSKQVEKTIIYQPSLVSPPPGRLATIWSNQPRKDGLVLCGLPVWADWVEQDSNAIPCGSQKFVDDFLQSQHHSITRRFEALTVVVEALGPDIGGQHIALHIARSSILAMPPATLGRTPQRPLQ